MLTTLTAIGLLFTPLPEVSRDAVQTTSLLGEELRTPPLSDAARHRLEADLEKARRRLDKNPRHHDNLIWLGRRTAYLGRYKEAVRIYSDALKRYPASAKVLRHRGHRFITLRRFDAAVADFEEAARLTRGQPDQIEPDGAPNRWNIPTGSLQTNIYYHLGLARYLKGDFEGALDAYRTCLALSKNDDTAVAASHWLYMILRRLDRDEEAAEVLAGVHPGMRILENGSYFELLLLYKGERRAEDLLQEDADDLQLATSGYGVGNWHLYNGRPDKARRIFKRIIALPGWAAFGYIAAEAELARERE